MKEKTLEEGRKEARIVKLLEKLLDNRDHVRISKIGKIYREDIPPKYKYEVIAPKIKDSCYPEFTQEDDLEEALKSLSRRS